MAARGDPSFLNAQPGFLNASRRQPQPAPASNFLVRFWREQIAHPEKQAGNLAIAWGLGIALAGVTFIRTVGKEVLVPVL
ncbi:unnamed protein product [Parajaminaea phylloscopi]